MIQYKNPIPIMKAQRGQELRYRNLNSNRVHVDPSGYLVDWDGNRYTAAALPDQREEGLVVIGRRRYPMFSPEWQAQRAADQNQFDREMARNYFDSTPTLPNVTRGAYHWIRGHVLSRSEDPESYRYITGIVDLPMLSKKKLVTQTGKTVGNLVENVGRRVGRAAESAPARTFEEGVQVGFQRGLAKGERQAQQTLEQVTKGTVSKETAKRYGNMRASNATRDMVSKETMDINLGIAQATAQKEKERAFNVGRKWGERHAQTAPTQKKGMMDKLKDRIKGKTQKEKPQEGDDSTDGFMKTAKRTIWETRNNNFGDAWRWRNAGRAFLSPVTVPFTINTVAGVSGLMFGVGKRSGGDPFNSFKTMYNLGAGSDSTEVNNSSVRSDSTKTDTTKVNNQPQYKTLDSLRQAAIQSSIDLIDSVSNSN